MEYFYGRFIVCNYLFKVLSEYAGGHNLSVHFRNHVPVPIELLRVYTKQILNALKYLHDHSIVHRDLTVSNSNRFHL